MTLAEYIADMTPLPPRQGDDSAVARWAPSATVAAYLAMSADQRAEVDRLDAELSRAVLAALTSA